MGSGIRIKSVKPDAMTAEQSAAAAILASGPRGAVRGPFAVLLNSPGAFRATQRLGSYLRFESTIPANLRELAIIVTAQHWQQAYEWQIHFRLALEAGIDETAIAAIAIGHAPTSLLPDELAIYNFCRQLHLTGSVDDQVFASAEAVLGSPEIIDLCAICGYYAMLAMVMNVARNPLPDGPSPFVTISQT